MFLNLPHIGGKIKTKLTISMPPNTDEETEDGYNIAHFYLKDD